MQQPTPASHSARAALSDWYVRWARGVDHPMKLRLERWVSRALRFDEEIVAASPAGVRYRLHPRDFVQREILRHGAYEPLTLALMAELLAPGDTMVDVGGHVGQYALHAARCVGREGRVVAFEPNPRTYQILQDNIALNGATNVIAVLCAVGRVAGVVAMSEIAEGNLGQTRFAYPGCDGTTFHVPVVPLSMSLPSLGVERVTLLKIDVEGVEPDVVASLDLGGPLRPRHILFEYVPELILSQGNAPESLLAALRDAGYRLRTVRGDDFLTDVEPPEMNIWADGSAAEE